MSRTIGFVEAAAALAVAAASGMEAPNKAFLENTADMAASPPVQEIPATETAEEPTEPESVAEPAESEKPKRGRKKAEVSDESDSDG